MNTPQGKNKSENARLTGRFVTDEAYGLTWQLIVNLSS
jgi:hypothetical protein